MTELEKIELAIKYSSEDIEDSLVEIKTAIESSFISPNESDSNHEAANIVDVIGISGRKVSSALESVAKAIREHTEAITKINAIRR